MDFMKAYMRIPQFTGKKLIMKVSVEERDWTDDDGNERTFYSNRPTGFFSLTHPKKGIAWVKATQFALQQAILDEQGDD